MTPQPIDAARMRRARTLYEKLRDFRDYYSPAMESAFKNNTFTEWDVRLIELLAKDYDVTEGTHGRKSPYFR